jgi:hypothetical protein
MPFLLFSFLRCRLCCHLDAHPGKPPHFRCDRRSEGGNPQRPDRHCSQHNRRTAGNNNEYGQFVIEVPSGNISLSVQGQFIKPYQCELPTAVSSEDLKIEIEYLIPPIHHSIVITASALNVGIDNLTDKQYYETQISSSRESVRLLKRSNVSMALRDIHSGLRLVSLFESQANADTRMNFGQFIHLSRAR